MWPERIQQSKAPEWPSAETMNLTLVANLKWSFPNFTDRLFVYCFCFPRALKLHFNTLSQSSVNSPINWHAPVYCLVHHHKARGQRVTGCLVSSKNPKTAAQMRSRGGEQSWRTKRFYWRASRWGAGALRKAELPELSLLHPVVV